MDSDGKAAIFAALRFAAEAHDGQCRKGTRIPYLIHPLRVAKILLDYGCPEELAVAGLLHDTVEDTDVTLDEIRAIFGDKVAELVEFATEPSKLWSWEKRKQHTLELLESGPIHALCLSIADKLDNARTLREDLQRIGDKAWQRFRRPREKQIWYFQSLQKVFDARLTAPPGSLLAAQFRAEIAAILAAS